MHTNQISPKGSGPALSRPAEYFQLVIGSLGRIRNRAPIADVLFPYRIYGLKHGSAYAAVMCAVHQLYWAERITTIARSNEVLFKMCF